MKRLIKKLIFFMPKSWRRQLLKLRELRYSAYSARAMSREGVEFRAAGGKHRHEKPRILFYHPSGLNSAGTEKHLQILAKHLDKSRYDVFFMYSPKPRRIIDPDRRLDGRLSYMEGTGVKLISFDYDSMDEHYPFVIRKSRPDIFRVIRDNEIDLLVYAGIGYSEFPINLIRDIPIILLNVFGFISVQRNIALNIGISNEVSDKVRPFVEDERIKVMYIPSEGPGEGSAAAGKRIRERFSIPDHHTVFGRIGRDTDAIFDPIGIRAFQKLVARDETVHYLIMSPMPIVKKIAAEDGIPNVHFLEPSPLEEDVWAFHQAIDCVAHFRYDGESFGLNIAESMLCGKPVITHRSPIWNAHLEYLKPEFSRVADIGDVEGYYEHMKEFSELKRQGRLAGIGSLAKAQADSLFLIDKSIVQFESWLNTAI